MARKKKVKRLTMTPPEYAMELGISVAKVLAFIKMGDLPALNLAADSRLRPRYIIDKQARDEFESSRRMTPNPDAVLSTTQRLKRQHQTGVKEFF